MTNAAYVYCQREQLEQTLQTIDQAASILLQQQPEIGFVAFNQQLQDQLKLYQNARVEQAAEAFYQKHKALFGRRHQASIRILGAGPSGLLSGLVLQQSGHRVSIDEMRSDSDFCMRPQNVSYREAESRLRSLIGEDIYQQFFHHGASLDGNTGKLRITTGGYQQILSEAFIAAGGQLYFGRGKTLTDLANEQPDVILLATGAHAAERLQLQQQLLVETFPQYSAGGYSGLIIQPSTATPGYQRREREGLHWRRDNISVYSGAVFSRDLERAQRYLHKRQVEPAKIAALNDLQDAPGVEFSFCFGNDTEKFLQASSEVPALAPILTERYRVLPFISRRLIFHHHDVPVIAIGDANGSPHPLAAIGTLKVIRNIGYLTRHIDGLMALKQQPDAVNSVIISENHKVYTNQAMENIKEVFYSNVICGIYSQPRS